MFLEEFVLPRDPPALPQRSSSGPRHTLLLKTGEQMHVQMRKPKPFEHKQSGWWWWERKSRYTANVTHETDQGNLIKLYLNKLLVTNCNKYLQLSSVEVLILVSKRRARTLQDWGLRFSHWLYLEDLHKHDLMNVIISCTFYINFSTISKKWHNGCNQTANRVSGKCSHFQWSTTFINDRWQRFITSVQFT